MNCCEHDHTNIGSAPPPARASDGEFCVEAMAAEVLVSEEIPAPMRAGIAFAIRCAYGLGYIEGRRGALKATA